MKDLLTILQIVVSVSLIGLILIQTKGTGFGRSWGGATSFTRRGLERMVFRVTFVLTAIFIGLSLIQLFY